MVRHSTSTRSGAAYTNLYAEVVTIALARACLTIQATSFAAACASLCNGRSSNAAMPARMPTTATKQPHPTRPRSSAHRTSSARLRTPSFSEARSRYVATVFSEIPSASAISR